MQSFVALLVATNAFELVVLVDMHENERAGGGELRSNPIKMICVR